MSTTIDERVVEMRFDNQKFEQNVKTSMSTIEKLKKSLNLEGAAKGLENINSEAQKCNLTPMSNAIESVKIHFSGLEAGLNEYDLIGVNIDNLTIYGKSGSKAATSATRLGIKFVLE